MKKFKVTIVEYITTTHDVYLNFETEEELEEYLESLEAYELLQEGHESEIVDEVCTNAEWDGWEEVEPKEGK